VQGATGTSITILGSYPSYAALVAAHPTGEPGEGHLVQGDLYVWSDTSNDWINVRNNSRPTRNTRRCSAHKV